jgi:STE24 endopeptidase
MMNEVLRLIKASFNRRLLLYVALVTFFTMFGSIPIIEIKFPFLFAFIAATSVFLVVFSKIFIIPTFRIFALSRKGVKLPVPDQIKELSRKMGTNLKEIRIIKSSERNAFATPKCITFTDKLLEDLTHNEIMAVAAHELGHLKGRHVLYRFMFVLAVIIPAPFIWSRFTSPILFNETITQILFQGMMEVALLAFMIVIMIPACWISEIKADETAARFAGKENIRSALLKLAEKKDATQPSETHPSIKERVEHIEKLRTETAKKPRKRFWHLFLRN